MDITYDNVLQRFVFDFEHDGNEDIVSLTGNGYQVEAFGRCFYYGYDFADQVDGSVRSAFIKHVKFSESIQNNPDLAMFIKKAVDNLSHTKMELVKSLPANISFDMDAFEQQYLNDVLENGRARYTEAQKEEVRHSINQMLDLIHKKDYFTIAKDVRKSRFRPYMMQFLKFASKRDEELCATIRRQNVLVIDDVATSGSTINEILRTLRILNEDNEIAIFSLIGRKDLMADAN